MSQSYSKNKIKWVLETHSMLVVLMGRCKKFIYPRSSSVKAMCDWLYFRDVIMLKYDRCYVECQLSVYLLTCLNNWKTVRLEQSTVYTDLEWRSTCLQMEVLVLTSTLDSNWMDSIAIRTSVFTFPTSGCSSHWSPAFSANLTFLSIQTQNEKLPFR